MVRYFSKIKKRIIIVIICCICVCSGVYFQNQNYFNLGGLITTHQDSKKTQEYLVDILQDLCHNSDAINDNIEGIRFLTEADMLKQKEFEIKENLFNRYLYTGELKEILPMYNLTSLENIEDIEKLREEFMGKSLSEILKHSSNKDEIIRFIRDNIALKQQLIQSYLNIAYLNNEIVGISDTKTELKVQIKSQLILDSELSRVYSAELKAIQDKPIMEYMPNKSFYTIDDNILWNLKKEYEELIFKLNKLPDIKNNLKALQTSLNKIDIKHGKSTKYKHTQRGIMMQIDSNIPLESIIIEYAIDKNNHKMILNNNEQFKILMMSVGKAYQEIK